MSTVAYSFANDITADETTIRAVHCGECGVCFGMDARFIANRRQDHRTFYCPNGHPRCYNGPSEAEQLKRRIDSLQSILTHTRDQAAASERSARAYKGQVTRVKKRIANGVCPCCNRTFADVARHMAGQHPEFQAVAE